jgi:hypothetical protein
MVIPAHEARAVPPLVRAGTHPFWASFGFGPAAGIADGEADFEYNGRVIARDANINAPTQIKLVETFGYHFFGNAEGPALALELQESFGDDAFTFQVGPKFLWDFRLVNGLGLYLAPTLLLGYMHVSPTEDLPAGLDVAANGLSIRIGLEVKLILADRALLFFRPINLDINTFDTTISYGSSSASGWATILRWDMIFGGGVIF